VEPRTVQRARRFIEEHHADEITLGDVARAVSTSTFHFCKLFKKATGLTFTEHLSTVRITRAKQLLGNPQLRVSEIVFQCGFSSLTHFNRVFKKMTGLSPSQYRQANAIC
jgi:AraC-like DNA-binding protein